MGLRLARGDAEEAREIAQEAWIRAVERLESFRWESSLRTWVVSIALNVARERARRAGREVPVEDVEMPTGVGRSSISPGVGAAGVATVESIDLGRAIDGLPDGYRRVLVLHDLEGFTHEEIGRLLGVESGTSKSQLHRARARVRERLLAEGGVG